MQNIFIRFNILSLTGETELKKTYKNSVFLFHPDAHPENLKEYECKEKDDYDIEI